MSLVNVRCCTKASCTSASSSWSERRRWRRRTSRKTWNACVRSCVRSGSGSTMTRLRCGWISTSRESRFSRQTRNFRRGYGSCFRTSSNCDVTSGSRENLCWGRARHERSNRSPHYDSLPCSASHNSIHISINPIILFSLHFMQFSCHCVNMPSIQFLNPSHDSFLITSHAVISHNIPRRHFS